MKSGPNDLVQRLFDEVFNQRDFSGIADIVAKSFVEHAISPFGSVAPGSVDGPSHMRGVVEWLVGQFPDLRMTVDSVVSEGDTVAVRVASEGTNLGPFQGVMPPTGRHFSGEQSHWYRVADGRLSEHWAIRDDLRTMLQLGVISLPGRQGAPADA
jgi:predicted ester cyclase